LPTTRGSFPTTEPNSGNWGNTSDPRQKPSIFGTHQYMLLPFIEQDAVYKNTVANSWRDSGNGGRSDTVLKVYLSPLDPTVTDGLAQDWGNRGQVSYHANWHAFGGGWGEDWQIGGKARMPASFPDGTSNTIAYFERYSKCGPGSSGDWNSYVYVSHIWGEDGEPLPGPVSQKYQATCWEAPTFWISAGSNGSGFDPYPSAASRTAGYPINFSTGATTYLAPIQMKPTLQQCNPTGLQAMSPGGMLVAMMDGSVRNVNANMNVSTLARAILADDGFQMGSDW
jgi:hypothetical protein